MSHHRRFRLLAAGAVGAACALGTSAPATAEGCVLWWCNPAPTTTTTSPPGSAPPVPTPPVTAPPVTVPVDSEPRLVPEAAGRLLELVNRTRVEAGLHPLGGHERAAEIAAEHARAMNRERRLWHNTDYFLGATRTLLGASMLGENVAVNVSVENAHQRLMASDGHRANILQPAFTAVGIAVSTDGDGSLWIVQDFLQSSGAAPAVLAPPKPAAARTEPAVPAASHGPTITAPVPAAPPVAPTSTATVPEPPRAGPQPVVTTAVAPALGVAARAGEGAPSPTDETPLALVAFAAFLIVATTGAATTAGFARPRPSTPTSTSSTGSAGRNGGHGGP